MSVASTFERQMLDLINDERTSRGLNPLTLELRLNDASEDHTRWMDQTGNFSHTGAGGSNPGDRIRDADFTLSGNWTWGENIAFQSERGAPGIADDVADLHQSLMNSPGHRANILNPDFEVIGIGIEEGDGRGFDAVYVTQNFARTSAPVQLDTLTPPPTDGDDTVVGDSGDDNLPGDGDDGMPPVDNGDGDTPTGDGDTPTDDGDTPTDDGDTPTDDGDTPTDDGDTPTGDGDTPTGDGDTPTDDGDGDMPGDDPDNMPIDDDTPPDFTGLNLIEGTDGRDRLMGSRENDAILGGDGNDKIKGKAGDDVAIGGDGNDRVFGGGGDDKLFGEDGRDLLVGGGGNDLLDGGADTDFLLGLSGGDVFVFSTGRDFVLDFDPTQEGEQIDLTGVTAITDFNALTTGGFLQENGCGVTIDDQEGNSMLLLGVDLADLGADDFVF